MDTWTIIEALLLGLLEGLTEFIPVSSTGHILLAGHFLGFESTGKVFEVLIQFGAILAILTVYAGKIFAFLRRPDAVKLLGETIVGVIASLIWLAGCVYELIVSAFKRRRPNLFLAPDLPKDRSVRLMVGVVLAFLPAAVIGVIAHDFIKAVLFETPKLICIMLILGGIVLLWVDRMDLKPRYHDASELPLSTCLKIGLFQCLAMIPGTSRSGSTIVGSMLLGVDKRAAAEFSFFLAVPTMLGAFTLDLIKNRHILSGADFPIIAIGFVAAFLTAVVVVRSLLGYVSRHGYGLFGWWRLIVGVLGLAALFVWG
ncbi:undecaprenyl-diphosphate phosphatase [Mesorhizobium sp. SP-1A]|uniref:undecaprenyl-diphosphate phosphatase n=1 Tax=Mesorhizobium sp. SP-1A TaxID=3077840 RepID=UPI0028F6D696|nr:undecaprenyl-diphosphate phosphatase [Mesorhizobium sp. SP-1A]